MWGTARLAPMVLVLELIAAGDSSAQLAFTGTTIRLYEQDGGVVLDESRRMYTTRFDAVTTLYIGVEGTLTPAAAPPGAAGRLAVTCDEVLPDGRAIRGMFAIPVDIQAGKTLSTGANTLFGAGPPGRWPEGTYRVRCAGGGRALGETSFQMTANPPDVPGAAVRVTGIRLFPTGAQLPAAAPRQGTRGSGGLLLLHPQWRNLRADELPLQAGAGLDQRARGDGDRLGPARPVARRQLHRRLPDQRAPGRRRAVRALLVPAFAFFRA